MYDSMRKLFLAGCLLLPLALSSCTSSRSSYIGGISPEEAYRTGKLKNTPYVINGKVYVPMSYEEANSYEETGLASWYGHETLKQHNGQPTAYGEIFDPSKPSAAHKYLPLPALVKVTNLETNASIVVRVNDRGPFVDNRIIDLSAEAAKRLGFYDKGTAKVKIEVVNR
ncbi:septal ring lytic transglycosylase RlpA family protein [Chlorobium sp. KB01]|uniref:septal ring lytic transglycosylase RlpA family protein n=1 Tax=Chlorobium sp. KB01 TaxID=1917528 RepID=UPI0009F861CB|nr:septal ring lytic transglycosylase RlpA family protein [Chlorobium sp. KB01]